jgi:putative transposase
VPAISTIHAVLDRHDLVTRRKRRRYRAEGTPLSRPDQPNDLWCADYKGEFMLADRRYCYPLTITDFASRYLLTCDALSTTKARYAFAVFERTFKEVGCPAPFAPTTASPFASAHALYGLSKLSVWWLRLGSRSNGSARPSRAERPARADAPDVEDRGDEAGGRQRAPAAGPLRHVLERFNHERPHQALGMKVPAELYTPSHAPYRGLVALEYPTHDWIGTVTHCGRLCYKRRKINLSQVFAGRTSGVRQVRTGSGWSPSWTTISAISTMRRADSSRSRIPSARKCYLCLRK